MTWLDGTSTSRTGAAFESDLSRGYNAADFGVAVGASAAANDSAFSTALTACQADKRALYVPGGSYNIATPLLCRWDGGSIYGDGVDRTVIVQTADDAAVLRIGGQHQSFRNFSIGYTTQRTAAKTNANAIECLELWHSELRNLYVYWCGRALFCPTDEGTNAFFNNSVDNVMVYSPSIGGFHIKPTSTGNTGSTFSNIRVSGDGATTTLSEPAIYLESMSATTFTGVNVEWMLCNNAAALGLGIVKLRDCSGLTFNGLYLEGMESTINGGAVLECLGPTSGTQVRVNGLFVNTCSFDDVGISVFGVIKINDANTTVEVNGFVDGANVTTGTYYTWLIGVYASGQVARLRCEVEPTVDDMNQMSGTAPAVPVLREYAQRVYAWNEGANVAITGTAAPVAGTWAVGDRVVNTVPTSGGTSEWRCTTAGTPGTWRALTLDAS